MWKKFNLLHIETYKNVMDHIWEDILWRNAKGKSAAKVFGDEFDYFYSGQGYTYLGLTVKKPKVDEYEGKEVFRIECEYEFLKWHFYVEPRTYDRNLRYYVLVSPYFLTDPDNGKTIKIYSDKVEYCI